MSASDRIPYLPDVYRMLPQVPDMELAVLSAFVLSPREVRAMLASEGITADHFHHPAHAETYGLLCELCDAGQPLDFLTIGTELRNRNKMDSVGGAGFVSSLFTSGTATNAAFYIEHVAEKRLAREIIRVGNEFARRAYDDAEVAALVAEFHSAVTGLASRKAARQSLKDALNEILNEVENGLDETGAIPLNTEGMDGRLTLYRGDLLVITAPTSCGKSAMADQLAFNIAQKGLRVAIYTLEMQQKQTLKRAIARLGGNNADFVRRVVRNSKMAGTVTASAAKMCDDFTNTARLISKLPLYIRDNLFRYESISADIRAEHVRAPFSFIVIDYLQLIQSSGKHERKQLQIAAITQGLKALAMELQCAICLPSQVNKEGGTREAQDAENDASAIIKIHPAENENKDIIPGRVSVWKQREGPRHIDLPLTFNPLLTRFEYAAATGEPR